MLDDPIAAAEEKSRKLREQREAKEREDSDRRSASDEANRKKNAALRAEKQERAELADQLALPPTLFEMEQLVRVRNTYMRKVSKVFFSDLTLKALSHESGNRVQRMLTWRKKVEKCELEIAGLARAGAGEDVIDPVREEKNKCLREALLHWFASVEMYRKFKAREQIAMKGLRDGN